MWQQMVLEQLQDGCKISLIYMHMFCTPAVFKMQCGQTVNIIFWLLFFDPVILQQVSGLQRCLQSENE